MLLAIFAITTLILVFVFLRRDRIYLKKNARDVLSDEMRRRLNFSNPENPFPKNLEEKQKTKKASVKILQDMNREG